MQIKTPNYIHSDIMPFLIHNKIDMRMMVRDKNFSRDIHEKIIQKLQNTFAGEDLWFPVYNYDYCKTKVYDKNLDVSQVGSLSEFVRNECAPWRSDTPIFSVCGVGGAPSFSLDWSSNETSETLIDPFSMDTDFGKLFHLKGNILFWGSTFSPTFIHFIERNSHSGPLYRYDKFFSGNVKDHNSSLKVLVNYHVIPRSIQIKYDMNKIVQDLTSEKILLEEMSDGVKIIRVKADNFANYCWSRMDEDPFYLLTQDCQSQIIPLLKGHNQRFLIQDFEGAL